MWYIGQSIIAVDHSACILKWSEVPALDLDGYNVYMREGLQGDFVKMTKEPINEPEWVSPALRLDTKYFFYITATDRSDNESKSSTVIPFMMRDATEDTNIVYVPSPVRLNLLASSIVEEPIMGTSAAIITRFELGDFT